MALSALVKVGSDELYLREQPASDASPMRVLIAEGAYADRIAYYNPATDQLEELASPFDELPAEALDAIRQVARSMIEVWASVVGAVGTTRRMAHEVAGQLRATLDQLSAEHEGSEHGHDG